MVWVERHNCGRTIRINDAETRTECPTDSMRVVYRHAFKLEAARDHCHLISGQYAIAVTKAHGNILIEYNLSTLNFFKHDIVQ
jgi:hypothetical protein